MTRPDYCQYPQGEACHLCSLTNYHKDCMNNPVDYPDEETMNQQEPEYYTVDKAGDWILSESGEIYDADTHLESLLLRVDNWNKEDVRDLLSILDQVPEVLRATGRPPRASDVIDYSSLPTEPIPQGRELYPIWAMDKKGRCLVGPSADKVEELTDIVTGSV